MVNSFRKSLIYRAAPRWSSAFMRSQPNKSTGPLRGLSLSIALESTKHGPNRFAALALNGPDDIVPAFEANNW